MVKPCAFLFLPLDRTFKLSQVTISIFFLRALSARLPSTVSRAKMGAFSFQALLFFKKNVTPKVFVVII